MVSHPDPNPHAIGAVAPGIGRSAPDCTPIFGGGYSMIPSTYRIRTSSRAIMPHTLEANMSSMTPSVIVKSTSKLPIELQMDHDLVLVKGLKIHGNYIHSIAMC